MAAAQERSTKYPVQVCEPSGAALLFAAGLEGAEVALAVLSGLAIDLVLGLRGALVAVGSEAKAGRAVKRNRAKRETVICFGNMIHVIAN